MVNDSKWTMIHGMAKIARGKESPGGQTGCPGHASAVATATVGGEVVLRFAVE